MRRKTNMLCLNSVAGRPPCPCPQSSQFCVAAALQMEHTCSIIGLKERTAHGAELFLLGGWKTCEIAIEINTKLLRSLKGKLIF